MMYGFKMGGQVSETRAAGWTFYAVYVQPQHIITLQTFDAPGHKFHNLFNNGQ